MKILCFLLLLVHQISAQTVDTTARIDAIFTSFHNATPGVAVQVMRDNKIIYNKAFGMANLEYNVPNTTETIFECGSVSKQFTAASVLLLAKEGKLRLEDDVRKYVPELPVYDAPITIQHLLNHTSGLKDWGVIYSLTGWPRGTRVYTQELSFDIIFKQRSLNFTPGSAYSYSNSNYVLLVLVVERASGQSLAAFTESRFFKPLLMNNTRWRSNFREIIPHRSTAYTRLADGTYVQDMPFENVHGPGGLLTTTSDLLKWNHLLETHDILGETYSALRIRRGRLNDGKEIDYAAGLMIGSLNGFTEISHSGATAGYRAWLAYYPEKKLSIAMLSNDGSFSPVRAGRQVAEIFLGKESQPPVPSSVMLNEADLQRWTGPYRGLRYPEFFVVENRNGRLMVNQQAAIPIHPDTLLLNQTFFIRLDQQTILVKSPEEQKVYKKMESPDISSSFQTMAGWYESEDAGVRYRLEFKNHELLVHRKPGDVFRLIPVYKDAFRSPDNALYEFRRDKRGRITGFEVSMSRAYGVPFAKIASPK
jgi:CubicO group peptidase (beta-lactamase class C family)